jgi:hypothetical protein
MFKDNITVSVFSPFSPKINKSRVYMGHRMVEEALERQEEQKKENPLKNLEDLFMSFEKEYDSNIERRSRESNLKETEGVKHNSDKPQMSLLFKQFPKALEAIVKCSEYGHKKYNKNGEDSDYLNFKRVEGGSKTYADAGLRHRLYVKDTTDLDSQLPHSWHVAWNALAELELLLENK